LAMATPVQGIAFDSESRAPSSGASSKNRGDCRGVGGGDGWANQPPPQTLSGADAKCASERVGASDPNHDHAAPASELCDAVLPNAGVGDRTTSDLDVPATVPARQLSFGAQPNRLHSFGEVSDATHFEKR
jgi:hypothetical protein